MDKQVIDKQLQPISEPLDWNPVGEALENLIFMGDIHGEFGVITHQMRSEEKTLLVVCGDVGMGFYKPGYYADTFRDLNQLLEKNDNAIIFIRGNHDDPRYFSGDLIGTYDPTLYPRIHMVNSWELIRVKDKVLLCGGGAVSIDRSVRLSGVSWWPGEMIDPIDYDGIGKWLRKNESSFTKMFIATHTAPQEFPPYGNKGVLMGWASVDPDVVDDCNNERKTLSSLLDTVIKSLKDVTQVHWCYGHFHESYNGVIYDDEKGLPKIIYHGLNINEVFWYPMIPHPELE